jgi:nitroimidazol reductase NimA-like FMN-containing flavoprotein (pyridoxamine 5'-phosphate oxidase superfamily)
MPTVHRRTGLEVPDRDECLRLLSSEPVGRVAVVVQARPMIFPVNFALDGESVVFRSGAGSKVSGATSGFPVSFEIDGVDEVLHTGWSVVVNGVGHEVVDGTELARLRALELRPWASGPKTHWIRIQPQTMTGRRVARARSVAGHEVDAVVFPCALGYLDADAVTDARHIDGLVLELHRPDLLAEV